jgi:hypothetical protein
MRQPRAEHIHSGVPKESDTPAMEESTPEYLIRQAKGISDFSYYEYVTVIPPLRGPSRMHYVALCG